MGDLHLFRSVAVLAALTLSLGACATVAPPSDLERITYDVQSPPFCGRCDSRTITVGADDTVWIEDGHWAGRYSNWRTQRRSIQGAPGTYVRLREALEPWRPAVETSPSSGNRVCQNQLSDGGGAIITWTTASGAVRLVLDHGCLDDKPMNDLIEAAIARVPVDR